MDIIPPQGITKGFTSSAYWLRFKLENVSEQVIEWHLEFDYALLDSIELYASQEDGSYVRKQGGDGVPFSEREIPYRNIVFALSSAAKQKQFVYIRVKTTSSMNLHINLWPNSTFFAEIDSVKLFIGFSYGIALLALIYTAVNAIFTRSLSPLWLAANYLSISLYLLGIRGLSFQYFWPESLWWQEINVVILVNTNLLFGLQHVRLFCDLKTVSPRLDKVFLFMISIFCLLLLSSFIIPYESAIRLSSLMALLGASLCMIGSIVAYRKGKRYTRTYILGWAGYLVSILTYALTALGMLPRNELVAWSQELGFINLVVFTTIAQLDQYLQAQKYHESEQVSALEALGYAEKKYRSLFENAVEGIFQLDKRGLIVNINNAYVRISGVDNKQALINEGLLPYSLGFLPTTESTKLQSIIQSKDTISGYEISFINQKQETCWISVSLQTVKDEYDHSILLYEGSIADITESKRREQAEKQSKMAEASAEAKSVFITNMSHEIRTPMNAIVGFTDLAITSNKNTTLSEVLRKIKMTASILLNIINDILDFSKMEAGKLNIETIPFSINDLVDNINNIVSMKVDTKGLNFTVDADPDIPEIIIGDAHRINQILMSLINNAIKYTEKGEIKLELDLVELDKQNGTVSIEGRVIDTGIGMTQEVLNSVFSSFSNNDDKSAQKLSDTGLGLNMSKQLLELMQGNITVTSSLGKGSCFEFDFACRIESKNSDGQLEQSPLNILIIDDKEESRLLLEKVVTSLNHVPTSEASCARALTILRNQSLSDQPYDLVIIDWLMPEMDGIELLGQIQQDKEISASKMILVSSFAEPGLQSKAKKAGFDSFLEKPINQRILSQELNKLTGSPQIKQGNSDTLLNEGSAKENYNFTGLKVLLVEDVALNQELAKEILSKQGMLVTIANNGKEGFVKADKGNFDFILMDMEMPILDGCESAKTIRAFNKTIPIFAMTANAMADEKPRCLASGMNDFIAKPIDDKMLFSTIVKHVPGIEKKSPGSKVQAIAQHSSEPAQDPLLTQHQDVSSDIGNKEHNDKVSDDSPAKKVSSEDEEESPLDLNVFQVDTINLKEGLARCQGNQTLYLKLFADFFKNYANVIDEFRALYAEEENLEFIKLAHTFKGLSANLGFKSLPGLALKLEDLNSAPKTELEDSLNEFETGLSLALNDIKDILSKQPEVHIEEVDSKQCLKVSELNEKLSELSAMINEQKMDAYDLAVSIKKLWPNDDAVNNDEYIPLFERIIELLDLFEFVTAAEQLQELRDKLNKVTNQ